MEQKKFILTLVVDECPRYLASSTKKAEIERKINLMLKYIWELKKDFIDRDATLVLEQVQPKNIKFPFKRIYSFRTGEWTTPQARSYKCKFCQVETYNLRGFCSEECKNNYQKYKKTCKVCGKIFFAGIQAKYCGDICKRKKK